jgi:hypothetical protein
MASPDVLRVTTAYFTPVEFNPMEVEPPRILHVVLESGATLELRINPDVWQTLMRSHRQVGVAELRQMLAVPGFKESLSPAKLAMAELLMALSEDL